MDLRSESTDLLSRMMSAASLRARVLSGNIANQNTPGYLRQDVRFDEVFQAEVTGRTGPRRSALAIETDHSAPAKEDGNNVELEHELVALRENRLLYEACATILASHSELLRAAIESGR